MYLQFTKKTSVPLVPLCALVVSAVAKTTKAQAMPKNKHHNFYKQNILQKLSVNQAHINSCLYLYKIISEIENRH